MDLFIYYVGLSEFDDTNDKIYCTKKNNNAITTPIFDREKNVWMKKLWTIKRISKRMNITNGI